MYSTWQEAGLAAKTARREVPRPQSPAARCSMTLKTTPRNDHRAGSNSTHHPDPTPMSTTTTRWTPLRARCKKQRRGDHLLLGRRRRRPHGAEPCCKVHPFQGLNRRHGQWLSLGLGCWELGRQRRGPHIYADFTTRGVGKKKNRCRGQAGVLLVQIGLRRLAPKVKPSLSLRPCRAERRSYHLRYCLECLRMWKHSFPGAQETETCVACWEQSIMYNRGM